VEFSEMLEIPTQEESLEPVPLELTLTDFSTPEAASFPHKPENEPQIDTEIVIFDI
jgi:hypothetical protein